MVNNDILKEIVGKIFLQTNFFLEIIHTEGPSLLEYTDNVVKARIRLITTDQQGSGKATLCHQEMP